MIAVPSHIGMNKVALDAKGDPTWDLSPDESQGRLATAWVDAACKGGIILGSTYLWETEGLTLRNCDILSRWGEFAQSVTTPWILAGDFNMESSL